MACCLWHAFMIEAPDRYSEDAGTRMRADVHSFPLEQGCLWRGDARLLKKIEEK